MSGEHIKDIPESSRSSRLWIVLLKDLGDFALYLNKTGGFFGGFEVHRIRIKESKECCIKQKNGRTRHFAVPRRRIIAGSGDFGRFAWCYPSLDLVYVEYPEFKRCCKEIESRLEDESVVAEKPISRGYIDKTSKVDSHSSRGVA